MYIDQLLRFKLAFSIIYKVSMIIFFVLLVFTFPWKKFKDLFFNGMNVCLCGHVPISMGTYRGQKRDSEHMELEL